MKRRKMKMLATSRETLSIYRTRKPPQSVKERGLIRKRDNDETIFVKRAGEFLQDLTGLHKMLQNFQTKYGIRGDQLKRFL